MRNYIQDGTIVTLAAPYAVASGAGMLVGSLFGVATSAADNGAEVEAITRGVADITALSTDTGSVGAKVYWDNTNKRCTVTATDNSLIGVLLAAKTNGQTTMRVRLNGGSV
jgi:predicted RecA/RadA family phage recombinase